MGEYNRVIWWYQLGWYRKMATVKSFKLTFRALALRQSLTYIQFRVNFICLVILGCWYPLLIQIIINYYGLLKFDIGCTVIKMLWMLLLTLCFFQTLVVTFSNPKSQIPPKIPTSHNIVAPCVIVTYLLIFA